VALMALSLSACGGGGGAKETQAAPPLSVTVTPALAVGSIDQVRATGLIGFKREPALAFKVPGVIAGISVDVGDRVRKGQRLAWLTPTEVAAGAREAAAALDIAERNLARQQTLFEKGLIAQAALDNAKLAVERARAGRDAAGFTRDTAVIFAPANGVVLRRLAEPAQVAGAGQPVLLVGESGSGLVARAAVASSEAARLKVGAAAEVQLNDLGVTAQGKVTRLAAKSDGATGAFDVEIGFAEPRARSGQVAEVRISATPLANASAAVQAPTLALLDARADQGVVYVVDAQGVARRRAVQTAGVVGDQVIIIAGLAAGENVVSAGAAYVRDGEPVTVVGAGSTGASK
jgi:RND family efflux transporter MFP subunit